MQNKIPDDCMPACSSCAFFEIEPKDELGICRRYPPALFQIDNEYDSCYPVTDRTDWCGEFIRRVN